MKYLLRFSTIEEARQHAEEGIYSPHVDLIDETRIVNFRKKGISGTKFNCGFNDNGVLFTLFTLGESVLGGLDVLN